MRIAVCEDQPDDMKQITDATTRYMETNSLSADVDCFGSGEEFLAAFEPGKYQIVFMDIYMSAGGVTGIDAAKYATNCDGDMAVIFITTSDEYVLEGYNYAVYYVVKPLDDQRFAAAMSKCRTQIKQFAKTIEIIADRFPVRIRLRDICSVESIGRSCIFRLTGSDVTAPTLVFDGLLEQLGGFPFVRCHRSYIVNLLHVKEPSGKNFVMLDGAKVPISRTYQAEAMRRCREFFWNRIRGELV